MSGAAPQPGEPVERAPAPATPASAGPDPGASGPTDGPATGGSAGAKRNGSDAAAGGRIEEQIILLLMGAPGSGKGTQGRLLSKHFGIPYLASGDLLRRAIEQQSDIGRKVQSYVERGLYVPDDLMVPMVMSELERLYLDQHKGVILDGFPRTREQAASLDAALGREGTGITRVLFLYVPKDVLVSRLASRWTCSNCGATYNLHTKPPAVEGVCDLCGHALFQRVDDQADKVERRLSVDLEKAVPLAAYYHQQGILANVDGNRPAGAVTAALIAAAEEAVKARLPRQQPQPQAQTSS